MNIHLFLHGIPCCGYWVFTESLWKTRTFPQFPQVFPQAFFTAFSGDYPLSVDIIFSPGFDFFPTFSPVKKHTSGGSPSEKKGLDKTFRPGATGPWRAAAAPTKTSAPRSALAPPPPPPWEFEPGLAPRSAPSGSPAAVPCSPVRSHRAPAPRQK